MSFVLLPTPFPSIPLPGYLFSLSVKACIVFLLCFSYVFRLTGYVLVLRSKKEIQLNSSSARLANHKAVGFSFLSPLCQSLDTV